MDLGLCSMVGEKDETKEKMELGGSFYSVCNVFYCHKSDGMYTGGYGGKTRV